MSKKRTLGVGATLRQQAAEQPQFVIKIAWPTAVIECLCGAENMMVIVGDNAPVTCPSCGVKRQIATNWAMQVIPA